MPFNAGQIAQQLTFPAP